MKRILKPLLLSLLAAVVFLLCIAAFAVNARAETLDNKGTLRLVKQAGQTGNPLSGAVFGVYSVSDGDRLHELTTNVDGEASLTLQPGGYYLRELKPPYGYMLDKARILFTVTEGAEVIVEITGQRDIAVADLDAPGDAVSIPKTGEDFPVMNIAAGLAFILLALMCGFWLARNRKTG